MIFQDIQRKKRLERTSKNNTTDTENFEYYKSLYKCDLDNLNEGFKKFSEEYKLFLQYPKTGTKKYFRTQMQVPKRQRKELQKFKRKYYFLVENIK